MMKPYFYTGVIALALLAHVQSQRDRTRGQLRPGDRARYRPNERQRPGGRPLNPEPPDVNITANLNKYRCAFSFLDAEKYQGDQCSDTELYCYNAVDRTPGTCDKKKDSKGNIISSGRRCFPTPNCGYVADETQVPLKPPGKGKEYKCVTNLQEISEEDCYWALPCDKGGENPIMEPDESECRLHKDGSKCQLIDCEEAGLLNETRPETLDDAKFLGYNSFEIIPYYCKHDTAPFDCNTAVPCMQDSHNKDNLVLDQKDDSKCTVHHKCLRADECLEINVSFGDHIDVMPGLFHKHQATGHKIIYIKPNRCVPKNNLLAPTDTARKKELCELKPGCSTDTDCEKDETCQIDTCSFYVLHDKKGVSDFEHPYDHAHMDGKLINFLFPKKPISVMTPNVTKTTSN